MLKFILWLDFVGESTDNLEPIRFIKDIEDKYGPLTEEQRRKVLMKGPDVDLSLEIRFEEDGNIDMGDKEV